MRNGFWRGPHQAPARASGGAGSCQWEWLRSVSYTKPFALRPKSAARVGRICCLPRGTGCWLQELLKSEALEELRLWLPKQYYIGLGPGLLSRKTRGASEVRAKRANLSEAISLRTFASLGSAPLPLALLIRFSNRDAWVLLSNSPNVKT